MFELLQMNEVYCGVSARRAAMVKEVLRMNGIAYRQRIKNTIDTARKGNQSSSYIIDERGSRQYYIYVSAADVQKARQLIVAVI